MTLSEFDLIDRFFHRCGAARGDVVLGVGDDAALLRVPAGMELALTLDTLVQGVHFLPGTDPHSLGHKALAVNLSDLAAMGAEPAWATLALTLPESDPAWLEAFSDGFCRLARECGVQLVGGDTTRGPLALSVEAKGLVPVGQALRRSGARAGDLIFVSGVLGDAGLALRALRDGLEVDDLDYLRGRMERPQPRLALGRSLLGRASAAIDISDGLVADLGHILDSSRVGAVVELGRLPCSEPVSAYLTRSGDWSLPLSAGDDYELCFTLPPGRLAALERLAENLRCRITRIGEITREPGLHIRAADGGDYRPRSSGYEHFAA
jgi:thiamine-monophosphate kinase